MDSKISDSEKLLEEQKERKNNLDYNLIQEEKLKGEFEIKLNERKVDKGRLVKQIDEKTEELSKKKEKFYKIIKFVKIVFEREKIQKEIYNLEKIKEGIESYISKFEGSIKEKQKEISQLKYNIEEKQKEIFYTLSQRKKGLEVFENRWVDKKDIPKLKEARVGITNNFSNLSPYEFEHFVAKLLSEIGYTTKVTQKTGDYGVDILAKKDDKTFAVQCKKYQEGNLVGNRDIQRILGAMHIINADRCIFVTTSRFTKQAIKQSEGCPIELWDKQILHDLVKIYLLDLGTGEIFSLMEREKRERLEREQELIRQLEEKREQVILKREERKEKLEEKKEIEEEKRTCPMCGRGKMKTRQYCSNCKREIRMANRYDY